MDYMKFDFSALRGLIIKTYGRYYLCAEDCGLTKGQLSNRLNNVSPFTPTEIYTLRDKLGIPEDEVVTYFFTPLVR